MRVMNADGSNVSDIRNLPEDFSFFGGPNWSPDGTRIAFDAQTDFEAPGQIYLMDADGSGLRNLTGDSPLIKSAPSWSPDGSRIAFLGFDSGRTGLYMMEPDGGNHTLVTELEAELDHVSWSPDGSRIAFASNRDGGVLENYNSEIYVMNADGSGQTRLTNSPGLDGGPDWSPDGSKIVFTSGREGSSSAIYIMNSDGSDQRPLIPQHRCASSSVVCLGDEQPTWAPDGTMVAFVGFAHVEPGFSDIFVVDADGTDKKRLTHTQDFEWVPSWQPLPDGELPETMPASPTPAPTSTSLDELEPCPEQSPGDTLAPSSTMVSDVTPPALSPVHTDTPSAKDLPSLETFFPTIPPAVPSDGANASTPHYPGGVKKDDLPKATRLYPISWPPTAQELEPTQSPSPMAEACEQVSSSAELTVQAIGLIALGVLAAGSAITLPFAALRRRRS
jgi:TolB protein